MKLRRLAGVMTALVLQGLLVSTAPASAAEFAEQYSYGGTAHGVSGNLVIRRPGLPAGSTYDMKVSLRGNDNFTNLFGGYRSDSSGVVRRLIQIQKGNALSVSPLTIIGRNSNEQAQFLIEELRRGSSMVFKLDGAEFDVLDEFPFGYDRVIARSYMTNGAVYLSSREATNLRYRDGNGNYFNWGEIALAFSSGPAACARKVNPSTLSYAHNGGC